MVIIQVKHNTIDTWDVAVQNEANGSIVYISHNVVKEEAYRKSDIMKRWLSLLDVRSKVVEV